jgi:hypothetical protein
MIMAFVGVATASVSTALASSWAITAVQNTQPPYCVAMREYAYGAILYVSANREGATRITLDLQSYDDLEEIRSAYIEIAGQNVEMSVLTENARVAQLSHLAFRDLDDLVGRTLAFLVNGRSIDLPMMTVHETALLGTCANFFPDQD